MNKYKVVSIVLAIALLATMARLVAMHQGKNSPLAPNDKAEVVMQNIMQRKSVRSYTSQPDRKSVV